MDIEAILDWAHVGLLVPAVVVAVFIVARGNGLRPLGLLVLTICMLSVWSAYDGLNVDQDLARHIRLLITAGALVGFPLWAAIRGGKH